MAPHSMVDPRATAKNFARSFALTLPEASAMLSGIESDARRS